MPTPTSYSSRAGRAAVGAIVWVFVDLWCPVACTPHLLVGHVLPLVLAITAGAMLGCGILGLSLRCLPSERQHHSNPA